MITDLLVADGRVAGALALDLRSGEIGRDSGQGRRSSPLAADTTSTPTRRARGPDRRRPGDGAARGRRPLNMEMTQFIPTTIINPPMARGNLFPFLLGPQNGLRYWLLDRNGERFMDRWDPERMEFSTRDLLSIGIMNEILEGRGGPEGGVYYSLAHLPKNLIEDFARWGAKPFIKADWSAHGHSLPQRRRPPEGRRGHRGLARRPLLHGRRPDRRADGDGLSPACSRRAKSPVASTALIASRETPSPRS